MKHEKKRKKTSLFTWEDNATEARCWSAGTVIRLVGSVLQGRLYTVHGVHRLRPPRVSTVRNCRTYEKRTLCILCAG